MTTTPADGDDPAAAPRPGRRRLRAVLGLIAVAVVAVLALAVGALAFLLPRSGDTTDPLGDDAPGLTSVTLRTTGCTFQPERGGMVAHFIVRTHVAGRFTVDVKAVTAEGADNLDIATQHVVRYTVPFYGGQTRREFDVVVPLSEKEHQDGYRECRYDLNPPA